MRAPLVLATLKLSYSSRAPTLPMCAPAPTPQANSVPRSEKEIRLAGPAIPTVLPSDCQRARPALPNTSRKGTGIGRKPTA